MRGLQQGNENVTEDQALAFKYLYFGRKDTRVPLEPIENRPRHNQRESYFRSTSAGMS